MQSGLRRLVWKRANNCCEYCRLLQDDEPYFRFHIEHITPIQHDGTDHPDNLALACHHCNHPKGPNLTSFDPKSGRLVRLFHPRRQRWAQHFRLIGFRIVGRTPVGRATVALLKMNAADRTELRKALKT